jgi:hypothetical protein
MLAAMRYLRFLVFAAFLQLLGLAALPCFACQNGPRADEIEAQGSTLLGFGACRLLEEYTIPSGRGDIAVKIYANAPAQPENLVSLSMAFENAGNTLAELGPYTSAPIEVFLSPDEHQEDSGLAAVAGASTRDGTVADETCIISIFLPVEIGALRQFIAHEFFHCVQYHETVMPNTSSVHGSETDEWWVEGGAEWFATEATPGAVENFQFISDFDNASKDTPITGLSYEALVFWWWFAQTRGRSEAASTILGLPLGAEAQADAFAEIVGEEEFHDFGKYYLSGRIQMPGGGEAPTLPDYGEPRVWSESKSEDFEAGRNVVYRTILEFSCGAWNLTQESLNGKTSVAKPREPFRELPPRVQSNGDDPVRFFFLGTSVSEDGFQATIRAEKEACAPCRHPDPDGPESCLIGNWELVAGGYGAKVADLLNRPELQVLTYPDPERFLTFQANGQITASSAGEAGHLESATKDGNIIADFNLALTKNGYWSADGERLHICYQAGGEFNLSGILIDPKGDRDSFNQPNYLGPAIEQRSVRTYRCEGNQMEMVQGTEAGPLAIQSTYEK